MVVEQRLRARTFLELHQGPKTLVLPNAWDVASARVFEEAGFPAVATTSAGVAFALGYPDGERLPLEELLDVVGRIARALEVPLSVDFEAGYGARPEDAARSVRRLLEEGAVGLNLEDSRKGEDGGLEEASLQVEKIRAVREVGEDLGVPLVINARTDVFLAAVGEPESRLDHAVRRANAYREASMSERKPSTRVDWPFGREHRAVPSLLQGEVTLLRNHLPSPDRLPSASPGCWTRDESSVPGSVREVG